MAKIILFGRKSCGPCKVAENALKAAKSKGLITAPLEKVDADADTDAVEAWDVSSVPTIIAVDGSGELGRWSGLPVDVAAIAAATGGSTCSK